jgi:spore coat protein U-like protein
MRAAMKIRLYNLLLAINIALIFGILVNSPVLAQTITLRATVVSKGHCSFSNTSAVLDFGDLNPLDPKLVEANTDIAPLSFACVGGGNNGVDYAVSITDSLYGTSSIFNMQHQDGTNYQIPYELKIAPISGHFDKNKKDSQEITVEGKIKADSYQYAPFGTYEDEVTISVIP